SILAPYLYESIPWGGGLGKPEIADTSVRVVEAEWLIASLKRLLLYHHRVFIPDWFLWLLDYVRFPSDDPAKRRADLDRVLQYLTVIAELRPLFEADIINLVPSEALDLGAENRVR